MYKRERGREWEMEREIHVYRERDGGITEGWEPRERLRKQETGGDGGREKQSGVGGREEWGWRERGLEGEVER